MLQLIEAHGSGALMAILGFLVLAYVGRIKRDIDSAHVQLGKLTQQQHEMQLDIARNYPTAADVGQEVRTALEPLLIRLNSGDQRSERMEEMIDKIGEKVDRMLTRTRVRADS